MPKKTKKTKEQKTEVDSDAEIEYSEDEEFSTGKDFQDKLKKLKDELKECKKERQEHLDGWQRARADYANLKTEEEKKRADIAGFTKEDIILSFLPILDSFDMAFANKEAWEKVDKNWRVGVENIYNQFLSVFENNGISEINKTGVLFDLELHQSVETIDIKNKKEDNIISEIVSKGYRINGRVLRPARVKVYKFNK